MELFEIPAIFSPPGARGVPARPRAAWPANVHGLPPVLPHEQGVQASRHTGSHKFRIRKCQRIRIQSGFSYVSGSGFDNQNFQIYISANLSWQILFRIEIRSGSGLSKLPGSGFSEYGSETLQLISLLSNIFSIKKISVLSKNRRDDSFYVLRRILLIRLYCLSVFFVPAKIHLAYLETILLKYCHF